MVLERILDITEKRIVRISQTSQTHNEQKYSMLVSIHCIRRAFRFDVGQFQAASFSIEKLTDKSAVALK